MNWNVSGLILEGVSGSGKSTLLREILRCRTFVDREYRSAIVLTEHHTQRVLERKEQDGGLVTEDHLRLLRRHVGYVEGINRSLCSMDWRERNRVNMRVPYLFERFHLTHVAHYDYLAWQDVDKIDRRLARLNCRVCVLTIDVETMRERIIDRRDEGFRRYLNRFGSTEELILKHFTDQQHELLELARRSRLPSIELDSSKYPIETIRDRAIDFWGLG